MDTIQLISEEALKTGKQAVMITGFVFIMMLLIEYINVSLKGKWSNALSGQTWKQYVFAALLGAVPGCLGAFTAVTLFSHRLMSFGALVAVMIATSGDEAYFMFAQMPQTAIIITVLIFIIGIGAGFLTDKIFDSNKLVEKLNLKKLPIHEEDQCKCFQKNILFENIFKISVYRIVLISILSIFLILISSGYIAQNAKLWIQVSLFLTLIFALFIVITVPEHFLKEHLWDHIVKKHLLKIFSWIFGILLIFNILMIYIDVTELISDNLFIVLLFAVLIGIIPESGPHLIFITLFIQGSIPISILLASSIAQDGHGMLPLLAESKRAFFAVKAINILVAFAVGLTGLFLNF